MPLSKDTVELVMELLRNDIEYHEYALSILDTPEAIGIEYRDKKQYQEHHSNALVRAATALTNFKETTHVA